MQVELHRFELDADLIRCIAKHHSRIIRVARHRTGRSKLLLDVLDGVMTLLIRIWESLDVHGAKTVRTVSKSSTQLFNLKKDGWANVNC